VKLYMDRRGSFCTGLAAVAFAAWGTMGAGRICAQTATQSAKAPDAAASASASLGSGNSASPARFEVASIRLIPEKDIVPLSGSPISPPGTGQFTMHEVTLAFAIAWAFRVDQNRISGGPDWLNAQCYDISAKPEGDVGLSYEQIQPLMQQLLQERFHLIYHHEMQNRKGYALVIAKGGPKLAPTKGGTPYGYIMGNRIQMPNESAQGLASTLGYVLGQPVADQTGLKGNYDIKLNYAPMNGAESSLPSISTAVEEQLGLKLVSQIVPVEIFVIDHVDREPTEN
jgi:uncharacterized protein (TIGR03435 family)